MKNLLTATSLLLTMAAPVFAGDEGGQQSVTLKALQDKCTELAGNPQLQPFKASVTCSMTSFRWVPADPGSVALKSQKILGASIQMKSFYVPQENQTLVGADSVQPCATFHKVSDTVSNVDIQLSCPELAAITDLAAFCEPHLVKRCADDPALLTSKDTGEIVTLCNAAPSQSTDSSH